MSPVVLEEHYRRGMGIPLRLVQGRPFDITDEYRVYDRLLRSGAVPFLAIIEYRIIFVRTQEAEVYPIEFGYSSYLVAYDLECESAVYQIIPRKFPPTSSSPTSTTLTGGT